MGSASSDWALGWWHDPAGNATEQDGLILPKFEVRADGSFFQELLHCKTPDWTHEARWEPAEGGVVRVYPNTEGETLPFLGYTEVTTYFEIAQGEGCTLIVSAGMTAPTVVEFERGEMCMAGTCSPDDIDCECTADACGEGMATCDE